jgi:hypothetical protein
MFDILAWRVIPQAGRDARAAVFISAWIRTLRHPASLEIMEDEIRYARRKGESATLSRHQRNQLPFVRRNRGGRIWTLGLAMTGRTR